MKNILFDNPNISINLDPKPTWAEQYWWVILLIVVGSIALITVSALLIRKCTRVVQIKIHLDLAYDGQKQEAESTNKDVYYPPIPERNGYEFVGWFNDPGRSAPYYPCRITKSVTLYADWKKV